MYKHLLNFFLLLILSLSSIAQNDFSSIDNWLHNNLHELGGRAVIMIWKDGKILYSRSENGLNIREKMAIRWFARKQGKDENQELQDFNPSTIKPIASCSKWVSAAVIMTFVQEGKISLEDTIGTYLPIMIQNGKGKIKIKDCLSHLTGIKAPPIKESIIQQKEYKTMDEEIDSIANMPIEGEPGKTFHYSNVGLQIVGAILEKVTGQRFETLFQERIAHPCGLNHTTFGNGPVTALASGAVSSAEEYIQFLSMIMNDGNYNGKQILTKESIIAMQQDYAKGATVAYSPEEAGDWGYGFGEWVIEDGQERAKSLSSPGLFGTFPWVDNDKKYAAILFTSNINFKGRRERYTALKNLVDIAVTQ